MEMVELSGDLLTKVFEGPYSDARHWCEAIKRHVEGEGRQLETLYFFYTTCPNWACSTRLSSAAGSPGWWLRIGFARRACATAARGQPGLHFAHTDVPGAPAYENAIAAAHDAVDAVRAFLRRTH